MKPPVVTTIKRRSPLAAQPTYKPLRDQPLDLPELLERLKRIGDMAHIVERGSRDLEKAATDKNDLVRAIGRLEADLRRKGVR